MMESETMGSLAVEDLSSDRQCGYIENLSGESLLMECMPQLTNFLHTNSHFDASGGLFDDGDSRSVDMITPRLSDSYSSSSCSDFEDTTSTLVNLLKDGASMQTSTHAGATSTLAQMLQNEALLSKESPSQQQAKAEMSRDSSNAFTLSQMLTNETLGHLNRGHQQGASSCGRSNRGRRTVSSGSDNFNVFHLDDNNGIDIENFPLFNMDDDMSSLLDQLERVPDVPSQVTPKLTSVSSEPILSSYSSAQFHQSPPLQSAPVVSEHSEVVKLLKTKHPLAVSAPTSPVMKKDANLPPPEMIRKISNKSSAKKGKTAILLTSSMPAKGDRGGRAVPLPPKQIPIRATAVKIKTEPKTPEIQQKGMIPPTKVTTKLVESTPGTLRLEDLPVCFSAPTSPVNPNQPSSEEKKSDSRCSTPEITRRKRKISLSTYKRRLAEKLNGECTSESSSRSTSPTNSEINRVIVAPIDVSPGYYDQIMDHDYCSNVPSSRGSSPLQMEDISEKLQMINEATKQKQQSVLKNLLLNQNLDDEMKEQAKIDRAKCMRNMQTHEERGVAIDWSVNTDVVDMDIDDDDQGAGLTVIDTSQPPVTVVTHPQRAEPQTIATSQPPAQKIQETQETTRIGISESQPPVDDIQQKDSGRRYNRFESERKDLRKQESRPSSRGPVSRQSSRGPTEPHRSNRDERRPSSRSSNVSRPSSREDQRPPNRGPTGSRPSSREEQRPSSRGPSYKFKQTEHRHKRNYRNKDKPRVSNEPVFDKLPSYYTALSVPQKNLQGKVFLTDKLADDTSLPHRDRDASPDRNDPVYDKVPAYFTCFTNSTKYDKNSDPLVIEDSSSSNKAPWEVRKPGSEQSSRSQTPNLVINSRANSRSRSSSKSPPPVPKSPRSSFASPKSTFRQQTPPRKHIKVEPGVQTQEASESSSSSSSDSDSSGSSCNTGSCSECCSSTSKSVQKPAQTRQTRRDRDARSRRQSTRRDRRSRTRSKSHSRSRSRSWSRSYSRANSRRRTISRSPRRRREPWRSPRPRQRYNRSHSGRSRSGRSRSPSWERWQVEQQKKRDAEKLQQIEERRIVYVGRIPDDFTKRDLIRLFDCFGEIINASVHFREAGDNYGFVTFCYTCDAFAAIEKGNKRRGCENFDLCFGGRRQFCKAQYEDLDGNMEEAEEMAPVMSTSSKGSLDFDQLLQAALKNKKKT